MIHALALAALVGPVSAPTQVHPVQDGAGFLTALATASPGDTILVEADVLDLDGPLSLNRGLRIGSALPSGSTIRVVDGFEIHDLPADQRVSLRSVHFKTQESSQTTPYLSGAAALAVRDCIGSVHVMGGSLQAGRVYPGLLVERSDRVFVSDCTVRGGSASFLSYSSVTSGPAGPGIRCVDAELHLQGVEAWGGGGTLDCVGSGTLYSAKPGLPIDLVNSHLEAIHTIAVGEDCSTFTCSGSNCGLSGGSAGMRGTGASTAHLQECQVLGGDYPPDLGNCGYPESLPSFSGFQDSGAWVLETDAGTSIELDPWLATQSGQGMIRVRTTPDHFAVVLVGADWQSPVPVQGIELFLAPLPELVLAFGQADGTGNVSKSLPLPNPPPGSGGVEAWVQAFTIDPFGSLPLRASFATGMQRLP